MREKLDIAVLTQSPWLQGGLRTQVEAFWNGAVRLERRPYLLYIAHGRRSLSHARPSARLAVVEERNHPLVGAAYPPFLPEIEAVAQLAGAPRLARPIRDAVAAWVVTTSAHHGWPAVRARRPYALWVGTTWHAEIEARRHGMTAMRRAAARTNMPVLRRLEREALRRAAFVYATSPSTREAVAAEAGRPSDSIRLLPIPVDADEFTPEPDRAWLQRLDAPVIVFVGRAGDPRKNVPLLVDAFRIVRGIIPSARLRLVGRPPTPEVRGRLPRGAEVLGEVPVVAPHLRTASLLVLPSLQEGFGIVVAEALAAGVPVVVTPCGGPEHLVRASEGGVVLSGFDAEELGEAAVALLGDAERLVRMRRMGRDYVKREHGLAAFDSRLRDAFALLDSTVGVATATSAST
jgi:glycosyltransferase involved in cell wall biosynthesis